MDYNLQQGLQGGMGGAMAGAPLGPAGAIGGGALGLLSGFFGENKNDSQRRKMLMDLYGQSMNAPQAGPAAQSAYSGFRQNQSNLISRLEAMANGQGPSLARQQFEQATDRNMRGQQAMAASGRGGPLAQLTAANNMATLGANAAQGSALARTNEQMQAIGQLGGVINQGRQSDEGVNMFNAGQTNNTSLANLSARLDAMGMDQQKKLQILQMLGGQNQANNAQPGFGSQLMSGGAGLFSLWASQQAQKKAGQGGTGGSGIPGLGSTMNPFSGPGMGWNPNSGFGGDI